MPYVTVVRYCSTLQYYNVDSLNLWRAIITFENHHVHLDGRRYASGETFRLGFYKEFILALPLPSVLD